LHQCPLSPTKFFFLIQFFDIRNWGKKIPNILAKLAEFTISKIPQKAQIFSSKKNDEIC
jgi:hypothetical protein